jgi:hypothetical protein
MKQFFLLLALVPLCAACTARINGRLNVDGAGDFAVSAGLLPRISTLIRSLAAAGSGDAAKVNADTLVIDGAVISKSMSAAPGVSSVSFKNTAPAALEGRIVISQISGFLSAGGKTGGFISFSRDGASGGRCAITLTREKGPDMLMLLSPDITDYLSALMAPLATGEKLSKSEYLEAVESIYGRATAAEIALSSIAAAIEFPGTVQSVKGGKAAGRRAEFEIPLLDLLTLETPLFFEVMWK